METEPGDAPSFTHHLTPAALLASFAMQRHGGLLPPRESGPICLFSAAVPRASTLSEHP
jgi:hypothetical protein